MGAPNQHAVRREAILQLLADRKGRHTQQIADQIGHKRTQVWQTLQRMEANQEVSSTWVKPPNGYKTARIYQVV